MPKSYGLASVTAPQGHPPAPEDAACDFTSEEVSALVCQQKCVVEGCKFFCVEKPSLIVAGMAHTHLCAVHRDMRIEAQAARLENAIRDTRLREHLCDAAWNDDLCEAARRIGSAASSGIDWTRTEGAALYAAVKAGQDAFRRGATSGEVVAAIHAAGAESWESWEDTAASLIAESEVVGNRTARFGTSEERATLAEIAAEVSGLTRGERTWGRMARAVIS